MHFDTLLIYHVTLALALPKITGYKSETKSGRLLNRNVQTSIYAILYPTAGHLPHRAIYLMIFSKFPSEDS